ncbi:hypothetical protein FKM82_016110 [Ascaphus truei]
MPRRRGWSIPGAEVRAHRRRDVRAPSNNARGACRTEKLREPDMNFAFNNGEKWKNLRRFALLTLRNFGMGKRSVENRIQEEVLFLIKKLAKTKGSPIDITNFFAHSVSNVICSIIYGSRFDYEDKRLLTITGSINNNFHIMSSTWGTLYNMYPGLMDYLPGPHKRMYTNFHNITKLTMESIKHHEETIDPSCPRDYIDCFLIKIKQEKDNPDPVFYTKSLVMTIQTLLFGGTESVSTTLRYGFLVLLKYPEIAGKRICPGESLARMELFIFISSLLQNFNFEPVTGRANLNLKPIATGLGNVPMKYQCSVIPR